MPMRSFLYISMYLLLLLVQQVSGQTLDSLIALRPELSWFYEAVNLFEPLHSVLKESSTQTTIFVPSNTAINASVTRSRFLNHDKWLEHLNATLYAHIIPDRLLSTDRLFDGTMTSIQALNGQQLQIFPATRTIEDSRVANGNLQAVNGIIHVIDSVLPAFFDRMSLGDLERNARYIPSSTDTVALQTIVDFVDGRDFLRENRPMGATYIGCNSDAVESLLDTHAFLDDESRNTTLKNFIQYNTLKENFYYHQIDDGAVYLTMPEGGCGHMLVTKASGFLCFNDACTLHIPNRRSYLASNGVSYTTDKCLTCPGIAMIIEYFHTITTLDVKETADFFRLTSQLDVSDLRRSVGLGGPITLFATMQKGWESIELADIARLRLEEWHVHRLDVLKGMMVQGIYNTRQLRAIYKEENGPFNLTTLNGGSLLVDYNAENDELIIGGGSIFASNIRGIDGILHLTDHSPSPGSIVQSVFDVAGSVIDIRRHYGLVRDNGPIRIDLQHSSPRTVFFVDNKNSTGKSFDMDEDGMWDDESTLLNGHVFAELRSCYDLRGMHGKFLTSQSGVIWTIHVNERNQPCLNHTGDTTATPICVVRCDVVARNGIIHIVDDFLVAPGRYRLVPESEMPSMSPTLSLQPVPTTAPTAPLENFSMDVCYDLLSRADLDNDGAIRRPEFHEFLLLYRESKCLTPPSLDDFLGKDEIDLFRELACVCQEQDDAPRDCCDGFSAFLDIGGYWIRDQRGYREGVCRKAYRIIGGVDLCTTQPSPLGGTPPPIQGRIDFDDGGNSSIHDEDNQSDEEKSSNGVKSEARLVSPSSDWYWILGVIIILSGTSFSIRF